MDFSKIKKDELVHCINRLVGALAQDPPSLWATLARIAPPREPGSSRLGRGYEGDYSNSPGGGPGEQGQLDDKPKVKQPSGAFLGKFLMSPRKQSTSNMATDSSGKGNSNPGQGSGPQEESAGPLVDQIDVIETVDAEPAPNTNGPQNGINQQRPPLCKDLWKGRECSNPQECKRTHLPICLDGQCKPTRRPECQAFHVRENKPRPAGYTGNGPRGLSRAPAHGKSQHKKAKGPSTTVEMLRLKLQIAELRLKANKTNPKPFKHTRTPATRAPGMSYAQAAAKAPTKRNIPSQMPSQAPTCNPMWHPNLAGNPSSASAPPPAGPFLDPGMLAAIRATVLAVMQNQNQ